MIICLHTCSKNSEPQQADIRLSDRLPPHIVAECDLHCRYFVKSFSDYYLLTLDVTGSVPVCCFRCLETFQFNYVNHTELAVCRNEEIAERCMADYESIVLDASKVDLKSILTDDLHLYVPEKHIDLFDCDHELGADRVN